MSAITLCKLDGVDLVDNLLVLPTLVTYESEDRVGGAHLEFSGKPSEIGAFIDAGMSVEIGIGSADGGVIFNETTFGEPLFGHAPTERIIFKGRVSRKNANAKRVASDGTGYTVFALDCQDQATLFNEIYLDEDIDYGPGTDKALIEMLFADLAPSIALDVVATTLADGITPLSLSIVLRRGWTLGKAIGEIRARTNARCNLAVDKFRYGPPRTFMADFAIREYQAIESSPGEEAVFNDVLFGQVDFNDSGSGYGGVEIPTRTVLFDGHQSSDENTAPFNRLEVQGKVNADGTVVTSGIVEDPASIVRYGVKPRPLIIDPNIQTNEEALLRAKVELAKGAFPERRFIFSTFEYGLSVGDDIDISMQSLSMAGIFYVNRSARRWINAATVKYSFESGYQRESASVFEQVLRAVQKDVSTLKSISTYKRTIGGVGSLAAGEATIDTGLRVIDGAQGNVYSDTPSSEVLTVKWDEGDLIVRSSNPSSTSQFSWSAIGDS